MTQLLLKINLLLTTQSKSHGFVQKVSFTELNTKKMFPKKKHLHEFQNQLHDCGKFPHRYLLMA